MISREDLIKELLILRDKIMGIEENKPPPQPNLYQTKYRTVVFEDGCSYFEVPIEVFNQLIGHPKLKENLEND